MPRLRRERLDPNDTFTPERLMGLLRAARVLRDPPSPKLIEALEGLAPMLEVQRSFFQTNQSFIIVNKLRSQTRRGLKKTQEDLSELIKELESFRAVAEARAAILNAGAEEASEVASLSASVLGDQKALLTGFRAMLACMEKDDVLVERKNPVDEWRNIAPMLYDPLMAVVRLAAVNDRAGLSPRGPAPRFYKVTRSGADRRNCSTRDDL